ncbi:MAG TPA: RluA family pseudouridine synthase [Candidatus Moranbacteria bacterium]|nr:RluA family pseudouridine synthase [Candidatus Moranbacteria bacterium]
MKKIIIENNQANERIDKFLKTEFFSSRKAMPRDKYSRGEIIKKIKEGEVTVNSKKTRPSYILKEGDVLRLENFSKKKENKLVANDKIKLQIIFENENIIVINKPAGLMVHPNHNEKTGTLANALIKYFPKIKNVHDESKDAFLRPGIVHRLDKDTSGVLVVAKNKKTLVKLKKLFQDRKVTKKYMAVCEGIFEKKTGVIEKPIARSTSYSKQVIARKNTKTKIRKAVTEYKIIGEKGKYSVVEVFPKTGRMHQIRIHLASEGHPVVGDLLYTEKHRIKQRNTETQKNTKIKAERQLLHAKEIKFEIFGQIYHFLAPVPKDFEDFLAKI